MYGRLCPCLLCKADGQPQARRVEDYLASQRQRDGNVKYRSVMEGRRRLPAWEHRQSVVQLVKENQVVIVSGDTGCGKSTQVPYRRPSCPLITPVIPTASIHHVLGFSLMVGDLSHDVTPHRSRSSCWMTQRLDPA